MSGIKTRSNMKNNKEEKKEEEDSSQNQDESNDDETYIEEIVKEANEERETQFMNFVEEVYKYMTENNKKMEMLKKNIEDRKMETQKLHEIIRELKLEKTKSANQHTEVTEDITSLRDNIKSINEYIDETDKNRGRQIQRILNSLDAVHATKAELKEMETRLKQKNDQPEATQKDTRNSKTHTPAYGRIKFTAPIFNGSDHDQPMKFLRDLRNYCNAIDTDDYESRYIISQSLQGPESEWWQITESETDTWKNFEQRFTAGFWSEARTKRNSGKITIRAIYTTNGH